MQNGIFTIQWEGVKNALILTALTAVGAGGAYILGLGDVFAIDGHKLVNIVVLAAIAGVMSLIQHALTTNDDKFVGVVKTN
jgi:hypothetical protein